MMRAGRIYSIVPFAFVKLLLRAKEFLIFARDAMSLGFEILGDSIIELIVLSSDPHQIRRSETEQAVWGVSF
jgi:hypothetical protein